MASNTAVCAACGAARSRETQFCVRCGAAFGRATSVARKTSALDLDLADIDDSFEALVTEPAAPAVERGRQETSPETRMHSEQSPKEKRTIIEDGTRFEGMLRSSCPVDVRGQIDGRLETPALTVAASGSVHGSAQVGSLRSAGELAGEFEADTVELAGVVKKNTVIRARSLELSLASQTSKLELTFGEYAPAAVDVPGPVEAPPPVAVAAPEGYDDQEPKARRRRRDEPRHSEPPPAL